MFPFRKRRHVDVTRRSPWAVHISFCAVVFMITAVLVYHWGREMSDRRTAPPTYTATGHIKVSPTPDPVPEVTDFLGVDLRHALTAEANAVDKMKIERTDTNQPDDPLSDSWHMAIRCEDGDRDRVSVAVKHLVFEATELLRRAWKERMADRRDAAQRQTQQARTKLRTAQQRYEELFREVIVEAAAARESRPSAVRVSQDRSPRRVNPAWEQLRRQLERLEGQRSEWLAHRTDDHPAVRGINIDVAELQQQLAQTPRWLPDDRPAGDAGATESAPAPAASDAELEARQERLAELDRYRAEVKRAEAEHLERLEAEAQVAEATGEPLQIDVRFGSVKDLAASADHWSWGVGGTSVGLSLWMLALAAGLTMAAGLGLFAAGAAMEPTLDSVSELRQLAEVPVVTRVPAPITVPPTYRGAARAWLRSLLCLGGLLLMTGCVTLVWQALFTT